MINSNTTMVSITLFVVIGIIIVIIRIMNLVTSIHNIVIGMVNNIIATTNMISVNINISTMTRIINIPLFIRIMLDMLEDKYYV